MRRVNDAGGGGGASVVVVVSRVVIPRAPSAHGPAHARGVTNASQSVARGRAPCDDDVDVLCVPTRRDDDEVWRTSVRASSTPHRERARRWRSAPKGDHDDVDGEETKDGARGATVASEKVERRRGVTRAWVARRGGV